MRPPTLLLPLLLVLGPAAQEPPDPPPASFHKERRAMLVESIRRSLGEGETAIVVLRGAGTPEHMGQFYQDHEFYYLTGVREANASMLLTLADGGETLFVPPFSRFTAQWDGKRLAPGEKAAEATGFGKVEAGPAFKRRLEELLKVEGKPPIVYTVLQPSPGRTSTSGSAGKAARDRERDPFDGRPSREEAFKDKLSAMFPGVEIRDMTAMIHALRTVKAPEEVAQLRAACDFAAQGIAEAMKSAEPGMYEFQIAAAARYVFDRKGAVGDAYGAIVGSAENGCVLHYMANTRKTENGDLIVMDYAPAVNGYCADVTRTFPVNGKFTAEQRKLVEDVREVQQAVIAMVKPGARLSQLNAAGNQLLVKKGYDPWHGICHHVGLAVHDSTTDELKPGMLFTVEPGAYLPDKKMGCRIEDVVLVTEDGCEVLSKHVPSDPDSIEKLMAKKGVGQNAVGLER
jgi:Xaa-Pro aminopeptidase